MPSSPLANSSSTASTTSSSARDLSGLSLLFVDFETYYDTQAGYTLSSTKKNHVSMCEYIRDERFKVHGLGYATTSSEPKWVSGLEMQGWVSDIEWSRTAVIAHNVKFDGTILNWKYGVKPALYVDTQSIALAVIGANTPSFSLKKLAEYLGLPPKGDMHTDGLRDLSPEQEAELATYCLRDVELCRGIFAKLEKRFPKNQYQFVDWAARCFIEPKLEINVPLAQQLSVEEAEEKKRLIAEIGIDKKVFSSNPQFAKLLESRGYEVPTKKSPRTKEDIPALALGDIEFQEMLESEDEELKKLCEVRKAIKSTIYETRGAKLAKVGASGAYPFDVIFSGAKTTHRFSGGSGAGGNPQNIPKDSVMRKCFKAPEGHSLVVADFSSIELRVEAWLAGEPKLIKGLTEGKDIYSGFATEFYRRPITKADKRERQFGKCLAEGTLVLCERGFVPIQNVLQTDRVWDGVAWVSHSGVVCNGTKETIELDGLWLTPDHRILCGTEWKEARYLAQDASFRSLASATASAKLPSRVTSEASGMELLHYFGFAPAVDRKKRSISATSKPAGRRAVRNARRKPRIPGADFTGVTQTRWKTTNTESAYSIVCRPRLAGATTLATEFTATTAGAGSRSVRTGETTKGHFSDSFKRFRAGITRSLKWIAQMWMGIMNREMSGSSHGTRTYLINDRSETCRRKLPVYDLLSAGPRNRFTVWNKSGVLLAHNCSILGLGYGMGPTKFQNTIRLQLKEDITDETAALTVDFYRRHYSRIPELWATLERQIHVMATGGFSCLPSLPSVRFSRDTMRLPSGLELKYPGLRVSGRGWVYDAYKGRRSQQEEAKLYGGKLAENLCQALAGEICKEAIRRLVACGYSPAGQVHDELLCVVPEQLGQSALGAMQKAMTDSLPWWPQLKLGVEGKIAKTWAEGK